MFVPHPPRIERMRWVRYVGRWARATVKKIAADPGFLETAKIGVRVSRRPEIVRPIRDCRDAGVKRLQGPPEGTCKNVFGFVTRGYAGQHRGTVTRTRHLWR